MIKGTYDKPATVAEYFDCLPEKVRQAMEEVRQAIKRASPEAEEVISYDMPAFRFHGILVYYAAHKEHIGFYPADVAFHEVFREEIKGFRTSKGTIQFPLKEPIPVELVGMIVQFRAEQNLVKAERRKTKRRV